jgi:secondary thiamine-phosphate synthase enzyme
MSDMSFRAKREISNRDFSSPLAPRNDMLWDSPLLFEWLPPFELFKRMNIYTTTIEVSTRKERELIDITEITRERVRSSGVKEGLCSLYAHGATAALMVQENADPNITLDVLDALEKLAPAGVWRHDRIDHNGSAHIQAGIIGPSETIPIREGRLALSTWQNLFLCEFDGPRHARKVLLTIIGN